MKKKRTKAERRKIRRRRRIIIFTLEFLMLAVLLCGFYVVSKWDKVKHVEIQETDIVINTDINSSYVEEISKGYTTLAVFGVDGREGELVSGANCDVILLCSINNDTGEVRLASVYRDMVVMQEDGSYDKVNNPLCAIDATSEMNVLNMNLDLPITDYVVVNWAAVANAINMVGGVDVNVTDAMMTEINGYITETVNSTGIGTVQLTAAGYQHLDGIQAVAYCRLRHQDSDIGRTQRQRDVISQMFDKAKTMSVGYLNAMADGIFPQIATTLDLNDILSLMSSLGSYKLTNTTGFPFYYSSIESWRSPQDWPMFATDIETNVKQLHEFLYGLDDYTPSVSVQRISQVLAAECGLPTPATTEFPDMADTDATETEEVPSAQ